MSAVNDALIAASLTTFAGGLIYAGRATLSLVRKQDRVNNLLFGDDDDPRNLGLRAWQDKMTARVEDIDNGQLEVLRRLNDIDHELHPNEGASMRDVVDRLERVAAEDLVRPRPKVPRQRRHNERAGDER